MLAAKQADVAQVAEKIAEGVKNTAPEAAQMLAQTKTPVAEAAKQLDAAKQKPGEESKPAAEKAAEAAKSAAEQLTKAAAELRKQAGEAAENSPRSRANNWLRPKKFAQPSNKPPPIPWRTKPKQSRSSLKLKKPFARLKPSK